MCTRLPLQVDELPFEAFACSRQRAHEFYGLRVPCVLGDQVFFQKSREWDPTSLGQNLRFLVKTIWAGGEARARHHVLFVSDVQTRERGTKSHDLRFFPFSLEVSPQFFLSLFCVL